MANNTHQLTSLATLPLSAQQISTINQSVSEFGSPLLLLDTDVVRAQYRALQAALPSVTLHYALKPLPHPAMVDALLDEGASFDLATSGEVDLVAGRGVPAENTIHTHPIKRIEDIQHALDYGCSVFVVDNINELEKFVAFKTQVEILIRLSFRNSEAFADLSKKFGCSPETALALMARAQQLGIRIKGLSFHVGSQTQNPQKYVDAINVSVEVMQQAVEQGLPALSTLDIGGGFPVSYSAAVTPIDEFCEPINQALAGLPDTVNVLAEPGRFIAAPAMLSVASVMGQAERDGSMWYYLDDGVYGSFSGLIFDDASYPITALNVKGEAKPCVLAGPTCDSIDVIAEDILLPALNNGDLIVGQMMGAYTSATATDFNFFERARTVVVGESSPYLQPLAV